MTAVAVTELKTNFKNYAQMITDGEVLIVKRPKSEPNIVMISEDTYRMLLRAANYAGMLNDSAKPVRQFGIAKGVLDVPEDIDFCNDEIAEIWGETE